MENGFAAELKSKTHALHRRVEQTALSRDIVSPGLTIDQYRHYLQKMLQLHSDTENIVFPVVSPFISDITQRRKTHQLISDLENLRAPVEYRPGELMDEHFRPTANFCFGMLYVTEGSTLGGLYILKNVTASLGKKAESATAFLNAYGASTGSKWKTFLQFMDEYRKSVNEQDAAELIDGSIYAFNRTFELFNTN